MEIDYIFPLRILSSKKSANTKISDEWKTTFISKNVAIVSQAHIKMHVLPCNCLVYKSNYLIICLIYVLIQLLKIHKNV